jgi:hypothetical protein
MLSFRISYIIICIGIRKFEDLRYLSDLSGRVQVRITIHTLLETLAEKGNRESIYEARLFVLFDFDLSCC